MNSTTNVSLNSTDLRCLQCLCNCALCASHHNISRITIVSYMRLVMCQVDMPASLQQCYPSIRHTDGDIIKARDCVLVKSGMRKKDIPYVAKIDKFWQHPETGLLTMNFSALGRRLRNDSTNEVIPADQLNLRLDWSTSGRYAVICTFRFIWSASLKFIWRNQPLNSWGSFRMAFVCLM